MGRNGEPVQGSRVAIGFSGFSGGVTNYEHNEDNGEVHFDIDPVKARSTLTVQPNTKDACAGRVVVYI